MTQRNPASDASQPTLCNETDYRISKSLTMISGLIRLRAYKGEVFDPRALLMEVADRIDTVAELHGLLSHSAAGTIHLSKYLQQVCALSTRAMSRRQVCYAVSCEPEHLVPFGLAMPLGLITAELLSNSLKYAHPAGVPLKIEIICRRRRADSLSFSYQDDGVGFPESFDPSRDGGVGIKFIKSLSERLRGDYAFSGDSLGMGFSIVAPIAGPGLPGLPQS
jgi:two-component sensor histidine kinase